MIDITKFDYIVKNINSSMVKELQYSKEDLVLRVQFENTKAWYQYFNVCNSTWHDLVAGTLEVKSFSPMFNLLIKNTTYKFEAE